MLTNKVAAAAAGRYGVGVGVGVGARRRGRRSTHLHAVQVQVQGQRQQQQQQQQRRVLRPSTSMSTKARRTDQDAQTDDGVLRKIAEIKSKAESLAGRGEDDGAESQQPQQQLGSEEERLIKGIRRASEVLSSGLLEREVEVKLLLLAALTGEHLLLLGPPGTAKSELARRLSKVCHGTYFERLLTRFSVPEELFGPLSMKGLEEDRYQRQIDGYLPTAQVAFVDEIFKANSAILNALLTLLNERLFDNGSDRIKVPLLCLVGASNELPESEELDALYDRFLIRRTVAQVSSNGLRDLALLASAGTTHKQFETEEAPLEMEDFISCKDKAVESVKVPSRVIDLLVALREYLQDKCEPPVYVSDRRFTKCVTLLQVAAYANGAKEVNEYDCLLLQFVLGQRAEDGEKVLDYVLDNISSDPGILQNELTLLGVFGRSCRVLQSGSGETAELLKECEALISSLAQTYESFSNALEHGFPLLRGSLWYSPQQVASAGQILAPPMKENLKKLRALLEEANIVKLSLEEKVDPQVLEKLLPKRLKQYEKGVAAAN
jgi:MoxR-like ATPase